MAKILGIGNAVLDTVLKVPHAPHDDEELRASERYTQIGGNVSNTLYVLSQLGHDTAICTTTGGDSEAKQLISGLKERNINVDHIQRFIKGRTPCSYINLNAQNGNRAIVHYRDLPELSFDHFAKIEIEEYDWLHFEGRNIANLKGMLNIAKTFLTHQPISLEVEKPREEIEELLPQANLILFSHHYATAKGHDNGENLLKAMQSKLPNSHLICTWGAKGAWLCPAQGTIQHIPAETVSPVVDTLGAGDTFNAAVIHHLIAGKPLVEAVQAASQLAAQKCLKHGLDNLLTPVEPSSPIANLSQLGTTKTLVVEDKSSGKSVVLIKYENTVKAYLNNCPHQNVPLNEAYKIDVNPFEKTMKCSVHDAFFRIEDGICIEGPCWDEQLEPLETRVDDKGDIFLL
ncbi:MAG: PfkB family carbohydrate kinase [Thiomicrorhabdus chilensis]|uniref:PfkB family carbohydrate kinase n=1 Tax=Thiomicrorhabdus chilensis TaxID=63656 RepID=UPI00299CE665|nr:PfkB family carbohydrate kinase [Thiomicrorhabdus chilensis]MDX1348358.1 PfkB family carbohydrate kinase [Thiomicrorhabdus chilensis]